MNKLIFGLSLMACAAGATQAKGRKVASGPDPINNNPSYLLCSAAELNSANAGTALVSEVKIPEDGAAKTIVTYKGITFQGSLNSSAKMKLQRSDTMESVSADNGADWKVKTSSGTFVEIICYRDHD